MINYNSDYMTLHDSVLITLHYNDDDMMTCMCSKIVVVAIGDKTKCIQRLTYVRKMCAVLEIRM